MELLKRFSLCYLVLLSALCFFLPASAQAPPKDLRDWELICYCSGRQKGPDEIVREDNNGQILFAARHGTTRESLKGNGIAFAESQIELLKNWRLLDERDGQLKTQMPVLGPDEMQRLRGLLHTHAIEVGTALQPDLEHLVATLTQQGYAESAYSIVFSYLLDGMVWDEFDQRHVLPSMKLTADQPFWSGVIWAVYPRRDAPGSNTKSYGGWHLLFLWTQSVQPLLTPLNDSSLIEPLLKDLETRGRASEPARSRLAALGILTADGKAAVPVIHEMPSDRIHARSVEISRKVADGMLCAMRSADIPDLIGTNDKGIALIIAYHEFMWELLAYLEQAGVVRPPAILSTKTHADTRQIHDLVFFVVPQSK